jgi:cytochrome c peroxidase
MALPDPACAVRRVSLSPYASVFTQIWGSAALSISWPANTDRVCGRPNNGGNQTPLALSDADRATATTSVNDIGLTIAAYEASGAVSPFTSKYDAVQAGTASFTPREEAGYNLFNGRAKCNQCHSPAIGQKALFTSFTSFNIGTPRNPTLPYLTENAPDKFGYVANAAGGSYLDQGLGGYLASAADTNASWQKLAPSYVGTFQVPTVRNVAAKPSQGYRRAYGHNGFFSSLKMIVHFYNTRDVLPQCTGNTGIGVTCWPAPEEAVNENTQFVGNLGLSNENEDDIVAFLGTLTDGYLGD